MLKYYLTYFGIFVAVTAVIGVIAFVISMPMQPTSMPLVAGRRCPGLG